MIGPQLCPQCGDAACSGRLLGRPQRIFRSCEHGHGWSYVLTDHDCTELVKQMRRAMDDDVDEGRDG